MANEHVVREVISTTTITNVTDVDKILGAEYNRVAFKALMRAETYLDHGPEEARLSVVKGFMAALSKLSQLDSKSETEELRASMTRYFESQTNVQQVTPTVTAETISDPTHDSLPSAVTQRSYDQDDLP